tara:strand:- start:301 stop:537 length:237 start_codon:yes stop_codon:yes gene_type:complete
MEFLLTVVMCSAQVNACLEPFQFPDPYPSIYECMVDGYKKSGEKIIEIGPDDVNSHRLYIKFECNEVIIMPQTPKVDT